MLFLLIHLEVRQVPSELRVWVGQGIYCSYDGSDGRQLHSKYLDKNLLVTSEIGNSVALFVRLLRIRQIYGDSGVLDEISRRQEQENRNGSF